MNISEYRGKTIISWLYYNENYNIEGAINNNYNTVCYVYPRVIKTSSGGAKKVEKDDFPNVGRIEVRLQGDTTAEETCRRLGYLVEIKMNIIPIPNFEVNNTYRMKFNPSFSKGQNEIWIEKFSGKSFTQIVECDLDFATVKEYRQIPEQKVYTNEILLSIGDSLYGPFAYDIKDGVLYLTGVQEKQYFIASYKRDDLIDNIFEIEDSNNLPEIELIPQNSIPLPTTMDSVMDWIDDGKLIDTLSASLKATTNYSREQLRIIKNSIFETLKVNNDAELTSDRITRIKSIIEKSVNSTEILNDIMYYIFDTPQLNENLVRIIAEEHFDIIEAKSKDIQVVKEQIEKLQLEKNQLVSEFEKLKENWTCVNIVDTKSLTSASKCQAAL